MGLFVSKLVDSFSQLIQGDQNMRVLMVGLDNAGKTTALYKVKLNEAVYTIPPVGFNVETVHPIKGLTLTVWDVGGQKVLRPLWRHYYCGSKGLIYVVDSLDTERLEEAKEELFAILANDEMTGVPVMIFANKQDLPNSLTPAEVGEKLGLCNLKRHPWTIQGACATTGEGLCEGFHKLAEMMKKQQQEGHI